jgi:hypothetical protein
MAKSPAQGDLFPPEPGCLDVIFVNGRCQLRREGAARVVLVSGFPVAHFSETLYGGEQNAITINMSEFQEARTVSTLKGAPSWLRWLRRGRRADRGHVRLQLGRVAKRVQENHRIPFSYDDAVVKLIATRYTELESGGRMIDSILTNTLLPRISHELLTRMMQGKPVTGVATTAAGGELQYAFD